MLKKDRFKALLPELARIKRIINENENVYWELFDEADDLLGFGFFEAVPDSDIDMADAEEFDKYEIVGIVTQEMTIKAIEICEHPDFDGSLWAEGVVESEFQSQYLGLPLEDINLSPFGKIDAISECTMSAKLITETVREKIEDIRLGPA